MGFRDFMNGRNGVDELGRFLSFVSIGFFIVSLFFRSSWTNIIWLALIVYIYFRMLSRNFSKRRQENERFLEIKDRFLGIFKIGFRQARDRNHKYFKCPRCRRNLRVPRGKGRISIHCPTCGTDFIKRT